MSLIEEYSAIAAAIIAAFTVVCIAVIRALKTIKHELRENHGSSMKDSLTRVETAVNALTVAHSDTRKHVYDIHNDVRLLTARSDEDRFANNRRFEKLESTNKNEFKNSHTKDSGRRLRR